MYSASSIVLDTGGFFFRASLDMDDGSVYYILIIELDKVQSVIANGDTHYQK